MKYHLSCPYCKHHWWSKNPFPKRCNKCKKTLFLIAKGEQDEYKADYRND